MSGAAGAPVTLAPANRLSRIMSALALLSVPTSAVPSAPQGSPDEVASGFQALLAVETAGDSSAPAARTDPVAIPVLAEAKADAPEVAGIPVAPLVIPLVMPAAAPQDLPGAVPPAADGDRSGATGLPPAGGLGGAVGAEPAASGADWPDDADGRQATTPLPVDKAPSAKTNEPQIQPRLADIRPLRPPVSETQLTLASTAPVTDVAPAEPRPQAARWSGPG